MMLRKVAVAGGTAELTPRPPVGMAIGAQVAQPDPASMVTGGMGTKGPRGVDLPRASVAASARVTPEEVAWDVRRSAHKRHRVACT